MYHGIHSTKNPTTQYENSFHWLALCDMMAIRGKWKLHHLTSNGDLMSFYYLQFLLNWEFGSCIKIPWLYKIQSQPAYKSN